MRSVFTEDFYENKHLNSDLICCNFTELSDDEYYEALRWANSKLMKNYFDKQRKSTLAQIDYLYKEKDVTFRGFRHNAGQGPTGDFNNKSKEEVVQKMQNANGNHNKQKDTSNRGNQNMEGVTNWEATTSDGDRFSQDSANGVKNRKSMKSFDEYLVKKEARILEKRLKKQKIPDSKETSSAYTNWH